eukprot:jgi/Galph1/2359/GphlegSOOS_G35.1
MQVPTAVNDHLNKESTPFLVYKRTQIQGRVPIKLLEYPFSILDKRQKSILLPSSLDVNETSDEELFFLVRLRAIDIIQIEVTGSMKLISTFQLPSRVLNGVAMLVPSWKDAFAVIISCECNILLILRYNCEEKSFNFHRILKFSQETKDLLGYHLCTASNGSLLFLGSLGEKHLYISQSFLFDSTVQPFPTMETITDHHEGIMEIELKDRLVKDVVYVNSTADSHLFAFLLVHCRSKRQFIYFDIVQWIERWSLFSCGISLSYLMRQKLSPSKELFSWNSLRYVRDKEGNHKLVVLGKGKILFVDLDSQWLTLLKMNHLEEEEEFRETLRNHSSLLYLPSGESYEDNACVTILITCACLSILYLVLLGNGTLLGILKNGLVKMVAESLPNKDIRFFKQRNCKGADHAEAQIFAISSTCGLVSFQLNVTSSDMDIQLKKIGEIPCQAPISYVRRDNHLEPDMNQSFHPIEFSSTFGMGFHSGIWKLQNHIPLEILSHHEEQWNDECLKIFCLPLMKYDNVDRIVIISFACFFANIEFYFAENNFIHFETLQSTLHAATLGDLLFLQAHRNGLRLTKLQCTASEKELNPLEKTSDWTAPMEIVQATSKKDIIVLQGTQQQHQIYILQVTSHYTIQILHVLSCQVSCLELSCTESCYHLWMGTYQGTLDLYELPSMKILQSLPLDKLQLQLPKCTPPDWKKISTQTSMRRIESMLTWQDIIVIGMRDGYVWILSYPSFKVVYSKSLGTAPLQASSLLWWIYQREESFYFRFLSWETMSCSDISSSSVSSAVICPFGIWPNDQTLFISSGKQLTLFQVPHSFQPLDIWYSQVFPRSETTLKLEKYCISAKESMSLYNEPVRILVIRKPVAMSSYAHYQVQAWTMDLQTMLAHLVLPSHTAVATICVWKQFLVVGGTEESVLFSDIRLPNTKGRVVLLQLRSTKNSCRFEVCCEFIVPGAVMVVSPYDDSTLLVSCNEHLLAFALDPQEQTLIEVARAETRGLILVVEAHPPFIFVGDRKDSVHIYYMHLENHEMIPLYQDEYRKLMVSMSAIPHLDGYVIFVGDRQAMLHILWCPHLNSFVENNKSSSSFQWNGSQSLLTSVCSIPWAEVPIHLSKLSRTPLLNSSFHEVDSTSILAILHQLTVASMDGTWSQLIFLCPSYGNLLQRLQSSLNHLLPLSQESHLILDGDRLLWLLSPTCRSLLLQLGTLSQEEVNQCLHLLYYLEDIVQS